MATLVVALVFGLAFERPAHAAVQSFAPNSGTATIEAGKSTVVTMTTSPSLLSCYVLSTSNPTLISVSASQLNLPCTVLSGSTVNIEVAVSSSTPAGQYYIRVSEVALLGGGLLGAHDWHFTVVAPTPTTTSTTAPTTSSTSVPPTTSTTNPSTTTSSTAVSTSTTRPAITTTSSQPGTTSSTSTTTPTSTTLPGSPPPTGGEDGGDAGGPGDVDSSGGGLDTAGLSTDLISSMSRHLHPSVAGAVVSPLTVSEVLFRSLQDLLLPLLLVVAIAIWLLWRFKTEDDDQTAAEGERP